MTTKAAKTIKNSFVNNTEQKRKGEDLKIFAKKVLSHYEKHGRKELVWRKKITPYRILVSEVMLQQTQVIRVLEKFDLWMKKYPTLDKLAEGNLEEVLLLWKGLGYQRRAKALLRIAKENKKIPKTFDDLMKLPGIGEYTASAVMAFAYNSFSHPVLETNIRTALIDAFHKDKENIHDENLYADLQYLEDLTVVKRVGAREWYYALMDYGAYLKQQKISYNSKSAHHVKQKPYKGSFRELRAKVLFSFIEKKEVPNDERVQDVLSILEKEGYLIFKNKKYFLRKL